MEDKEIRELIAEMRAMKDCKKDNSWLKLIFGTLAVFIITVIFYGGMMWRDFQEIKDNQIPRSEWLDVKNKTNATYNYVFKIPTEARGQTIIPKI